MILAWALATALTAQDVAAQGAPAQDQPEVENLGVGVTVYEPAFFAQYRPQTALDMINRMPGFRVESGGEGGGNRGFGAGGNVLINGARPASKSDSLQDVLSRIPTSSVERIELIRGSAPGIDMQGKAVVVNVIRRAGGGLSGAVTARAEVNAVGDVSPSLRLEAQRQGGGRLLEGAIGVNRFVRGGGSSHRVRAEPDGDPLIISDRESSGANERYELTGSFESPAFGGKLRATVNASQGEGTSADRDIYILPVRDDVLGGGANKGESREYGLQYTHDLLGGVEFEGSALHSSNTNTGIQGLGTTTFESTQETRESIARGILRFPTWGRLTFDASGEVDLNTLTTQSQNLVGGVPTGLANPALEVEELRTETAANLRWQARPALRFEFGARYETSRISTSVAPDDKTLSYLKPRVLVSWTPSASRQFSLRAEREVSQLSFGDFTASSQLQNETTVSGNADIVPDQSMVYEGKYQWRSGRASFSTTYTWRERSDIIDRTILPYSCLTPDTTDDPAATTTCWTEISGNVGDGWQQSLGVGSAIPLDRFRVKGGVLNIRVMLNDSRMTDPTTGEMRSINGAAAVAWQLQFNQDLPRWKAKWGFQGGNQSQSYQYRPREVNLRFGEPSIDVFMDYQLTAASVLHLQIGNIFDRSVTPIREVYGTSSGDTPGMAQTRANSDLDYIETRVSRDSRTFSASLRRAF